MKKSYSSPALSSLGATTPHLSPAPRAIPHGANANARMRKSTSHPALSEIASATLMIPSNPLEHIGFHSILKTTPITTYDCALNFKTLDFPNQLIQPTDKDSEASKGLAACLATPSDPPEQRPMIFRQPSLKMIELVAQDDRLAERFNAMRKKLRKRAW